jgi:hypothetical protein
VRRFHPAVSLVLVLVLVGGAVAPLAVGDVVAVPGTDTDAHSLSQPENNTTVVRHENPDESSQRSDLYGTQRFLADRMGEVTIDCSQGIWVGDYNACDELNDSYPEYLSKYVDVSGRTVNEDDDEASETFNETRTNQQEYADSVRSFRELHQEYQEARENGDTERARRLAREMRQRENRISELSDQLVEDYTTLENQTELNLGEAKNTTNTTTADVQKTVDEVETDLFTPTSLTATAASSTVSFTEPLVVTGRLTDADGTALADRVVVLDTGGNATRVRTDEDGRYELTYRPTTDPVGETTYRVRYVPSPESAYLPSNATVNATVEPVTPEVTLDEVPVGLRYGDRVTVSGRVTVDSIGARGVPVVVTMGGTRIARVNTSGDGSFIARGRLPAEVPPGTQPVVAQTALQNRSIGSRSVTGRTTIEASTTQLTAQARQTAAGESRIRVFGRLTTAEGKLVSNQPVVILLDGQRVGRTTTIGSGQYGTVVSIPASMVPEEGTVNDSVTVRYIGTGTNLNGSRANTSFTLAPVPLDAAGNGDNGGPDEALNNPLIIGGIALALLGLAMLGGYVYRRRGTAASDGDGDGIPVAAAPESDSGGSADAVPASSPLAGARAAFDSADAHETILASYAAVRRELAREGGEGQTHWEFYRSCAQNGFAAEQLAALETLTARFERAAFSQLPVSTVDAEDAIRAAESIVGA